MSRLAVAAARRDLTTLKPVLLDAEAADTPSALEALADDSGVVVVDELPAQLEQLVKGRAPREALTDAQVHERVGRVLEGHEPAAFGTWVFYPWNRRLVHVLPKALHRELRLDRNRYAITPDEQLRLARLRVAVAVCRSGARSCRRWCTRASAVSCGSPTSTRWSSRT
jgi:hypothetical protein